MIVEISKNQIKKFYNYFCKSILLILLYKIFFCQYFFNKLNNSKKGSELIMFKNKNIQKNLFLYYNNLINKN